MAISIPLKTILTAIATGIVIAFLIVLAETYYPNQEMTATQVVMFMILGTVFALTGHYLLAKANHSVGSVLIYLVVFAVADILIVMIGRTAGESAIHEMIIFFIGQQLCGLRYALNTDTGFEVRWGAKRKRVFPGFTAEIIED